MRVPVLLLGVLSSSGLVACVGAPGSETNPTPDPTTGTTSSAATAIISVERTSGPGDSTRGDAVVARFIRVKQGNVDESALRIAGVATDLPYPGMCFTPSEITLPSMQAGRVELLDVGQVSLTQASDHNVVMLPRAMPDPAGVVSGFLYSTRSNDAFASGARITVKSSGGADLLDGFSVSTATPREITDVRVVPVATGLDVSWDGIEADSSDLVYIDVLSPAPRVLTRCTAIDAGHFVLPTSLEDGQVAVHRVHKESFKAKGIEPGEVRFDVAKVVTFRR